LAVSVLPPRQQHQAPGVRKVRQDFGEWADDESGPAGAGEGVDTMAILGKHVLTGAGEQLA